MPSDSTVFVDTNVLLYAQDPRDPAKQSAASAWLAWCWQSRAGRISTQVLHELYANLRRVAPSLPVKEARALVSSYRRWQPLAVDEATVDLAWAIQDDTAYSYWDCLMLAAAQEQGCAYLLTEDLQHGQQVDSLTILNPFLSTPDELPAAP
ncbi:MAG: PIN domain-containing protein [Acidovorax sp.]|uniref:PIN domain-containing protein n=1 Tax=Acidovorax sp. TaxID=1872122 RepID=UPI0039E65D31